ncbi:MAG TPA: alpha-E domain-containing protein [Acidimicrobiales bacterium]|nr:alpha-E domain-containing protein [Acidimicrobiales bacterium]
MTPALLSRVAESMFWIGRYTERAEGTARILDVVVHHALEERGTDAEGMAGRLLDVMGVSHPGQPDLWEATELLCFEEDSASSIAGALGAARDNARAVRHVLPTELWERMNVAWVALPAQRLQARRRGPGAFLSWIKDQTAALSGLADTTMSRDQTWLFLTLGRALERADVTARLLGALPLEDMSESGLVTLLRSCGGHEPYLRMASGVVELEGVVDFLLRDRLFPRSVLSSLILAASCIDDISGPAGWDEARGVIGLIRAELEFLAPDAVVDGLQARLTRVHDACSAASLSVSTRYFSHGPPTEWRQRGGGGG